MAFARVETGLGWGATLTWHGCTNRNAMDLGVAASERARQIAYPIRTLYFLEVILGTRCRGMCKNRPIFEVFGSWINAQTS